MSGHAKLGPSSAKRWMTCPGSTRLLEAVPDAGGLPAAQGTYCHDQLAKMLTGKPLVEPGPGDVYCEGYAFPYTDEMHGWVLDAAEWVWKYIELHPQSRLMVEQRSPVGEVFGHPDLLWGTADIVIVNDEERELVVADAKFGFEEVDAEENPQVSLYAMGMAHRLGWEHFDAFELVILQPRSPQPVKVELLTADEMAARVRLYSAPIERAVRWGDAPLVPSDDACRWCRAAGVCPAAASEAALLASEQFANPELLPDEALVRALEMEGVVKKHLAAVRDFVLRRLAVGATFPGWKRVLTKKHRQWVVRPEQLYSAVELLGFEPEDVMGEPEPLSPAAVEKKLKLKLPQELAAAPEGEPTLAPEEDERPALAPDFEPAYHEEAGE